MKELDGYNKPHLELLDADISIFNVVEKENYEETILFERTNQLDLMENFVFSLEEFRPLESLAEYVVPQVDILEAFEKRVYLAVQE